MLRAILSEKKYETKFMTAAKKKAKIMPRSPPNARPTKMMKSVSRVSKNVVLKVFPICRFLSKLMLRVGGRCEQSKAAYGMKRMQAIKIADAKLLLPMSSAGRQC